MNHVPIYIRATPPIFPRDMPLCPVMKRLFYLTDSHTHHRHTCAWASWTISGDMHHTWITEQWQAGVVRVWDAQHASMTWQCLIDQGFSWKHGVRGETWHVRCYDYLDGALRFSFFRHAMQVPARFSSLVHSWVEHLYRPFMHSGARSGRYPHCPDIYLLGEV